MNFDHVPLIELSGSPYEKGYLHGTKAISQIETSINTYKKMFNQFAELNWQEALDKSMEFLPYMEAYDKDIVEEIRGVADGSGKSFAEIIALNARTEIALNSFSDGCTSVCYIDEGQTYLGQNWDWKTSQLEAMIILKIVDEEKPDILMITEGGIIGKIGFNENGLGVCINALVSSGSDIGVPVHLLLRKVLESSNLGDAVEVVDRAKIGAALNMLISSKEGESLNIELSPLNYHVLIREEKYQIHTNHFINPFLANYDLGKSLLPDTFVRFSRINSILRDRKIIKSLGEIQAIFKDHLNYPDSICRHEDMSDPEGKRMATVFSLIMDLVKKRAYFCLGQPCINDYYELKLEKK